MRIQKNIRQIKLHSKSRFRQRGWTKAQSELQVVPWLNVSSLWLDEAGFHAGNEVEIRISKNQLIIKKVPEHGTHRA